MASAPTTAQGQVVQQPFGGASVLGLPGWSQLEEREYAPDLKFPASIEKYERMQTDAQIEGLLAATVLPIRRFRWCIDPNEARPEAVAKLAADLNLPIKGQDDFRPLRRKGRFSHGRHIEEALEALSFGFAYFEQVFAYDPSLYGDELVHLKKLATRPQHTISEILVEKDGGLRGIKQAFGLQVPEISVDRLVAYVWKRKGGNWAGRSMLRSCYRNWLLKDRVLRVGAINIERNGGGTPIIEAPPGASKEELDRLSVMAQSFRSGETAGGAIPAGTKLSLKGVEGTIPDAPGFIRLQNEEMARSFLALFFNLSQGDNARGSYALGTDFSDRFDYAQESVADWYRDTFTEHVIEDWIDFNYGEDEPAPLLDYDRAEDESPPIAELANLLDNGAIQADAELSAAIKQAVAERLKLTYTSVPQTSPAPAPDAFPIAGRRRRRQVQAVGPSLSLPNRDLRRQPYQQEVTAKVDYALMDAQLQGLIDQLVSKVSTLQNNQVVELSAAIEAAAGDVGKLAAIEASPAFKDAIEETMLTMAAQGVEQAIGEAARQGVTLSVPDLDSAPLTARAEAVDVLLTRSLSEAGGRRAVALTGGFEEMALSPQQVAEQTAAYLRGLSTSYLQDQLGGAMVQAMNTGRKAVFAKHPPKQLYASELLDPNACENCTAIDGTQYDTLADAEADYPTGGYADCLGGPRCRGTLVAVHVEETEPSV